MKKYGPIYVLLVFLIGFVLYILVREKDPDKYYQKNVFKGIIINKNKYPITGVDLSKYSGKIDFEVLQMQKIDFVYLKVTEGVTLKDRKFDRNYKNAKKHQFSVGAYHFLRFNRNGKAQAEHFLNHIKGKSFELPLVLDVESWTNVRKHDPVMVTQEVKAFISEVKKHRPENIIIYTNEHGYHSYIENKVNAELWICSFNKRPNIADDWLFWQHLHDKSIPGVSGVVDINTFNGDQKDWKKFLAKQPKR